jgi:hypothetical protein
LPLPSPVKQTALLVLQAELRVEPRADLALLLALHRLLELLLQLLRLVPQTVSLALLHLLLVLLFLLCNIFRLSPFRLFFFFLSCTFKSSDEIHHCSYVSSFQHGLVDTIRVVGQLIQHNHSNTTKTFFEHRFYSSGLSANLSDKMSLTRSHSSRVEPSSPEKLYYHYFKNYYLLFFHPKTLFMLNVDYCHNRKIDWKEVQKEKPL